MQFVWVFGIFQNEMSFINNNNNNKKTGLTYYKSL